MSDRVKIRLYWLTAAVWPVVWALQLARVTILDAAMNTGLMAVIFLVSFGLFILVTAWSKEAREEAKSMRMAERRPAHELERT